MPYPSFLNEFSFMTLFVDRPKGKEILLHSIHLSLATLLSKNMLITWRAIHSSHHEVTWSEHYALPRRIIWTCG
jgi:hypothetical protein